MRKKLLAILLCLVMVAGVLPIAAFAEESYGLYVNGEQFTSAKLSIACGEGTATYDPATETLTLDNAVITNGDNSGDNPKYGIRVIGNADLTIKLSGTNSITLENCGGILADGDSVNYHIIGDGKLTIDVTWDALYTLNGNIEISDGAELDIKSTDGSGITSYNKGNISIDNAKVKSVSMYSAASAKELTVKNGSEVKLEATADRFNAAYMGNENGSGKIEIINSELTAKSYYPALYTEGNLTIDGGKVDCTSTADSAIWTLGDILIKGNAKVITDGKYPMGGKSITVEAADIDAKNTNENNIPAIFDECVPVVSDGYVLKYAQAVDSAGTEIDLLSSGTQYFALYKNVHFITNEIIDTIEAPFTATVKLGDNVNAGKTTFTLDVVRFHVGEESVADVKCIGSVATNGEGSYNGTLIITGPRSQVERFLCEGAVVRQIKGDEEGWTYSDAVWALIPEYVQGDSSETISGVRILPGIVEKTDNGNEYHFDWEGQPVDRMTFENIYTAHAHDYQIEHDKASHWNECKDCHDIQNKEAHKYGEWKVTKEATETEKGEKTHICSVCAYAETEEIAVVQPSDGKNPQTGDSREVMLGAVLLVISGSVLAGTTFVSKKKKYNR